MKKGKLYTVNPYNKIAFMPEERNYFAFGDALYSPNFKSASYGNLSGLKQDTVGQYLNSKNFLGISKKNNLFSKVNIGSTLMSAAPALGTAVGNIGKSLISNGFSTGIGEGISSVGFTIGNAVSSVNPVLGGIISAGSGLLGGAWNAGFGVKYNDNVINGIKDNASRMENAGNALAQADTNASVMDAARGMGSTVDIDYHDLGSTGFLRTNNALKREKARLDRTQNLALARQNRGLITGASQADQTLDDNVMGTFIYANGGPLYTPDTAIGYGLATDYMNNYRDKVNTENNMTNMNTLPVGDNLFAKGGGIHINPKNKGKFNATKKRTGKTTEELTHSKNPLTRKRAIFAQNARKWRHNEGGLLNLFDEGGPKWVTSIGTVGPGGFVPNRKKGKDEDTKAGVYGGGTGGGGGIGTPFYHIPERIEQVRNDTLWVPVTRTFNDAFREAAMKGLDSFVFNGVTHPVEYSDRPGWKEAGDSRVEETLVPVPFESKKINYQAEGGPINILCGGGKTFFDFGGNMGTNSSDFTTGLMHIDEGGSHETNPNEGVQLGTDAQGVPNLVEEGEVVYDGYVFSNRINIDDTTKDAFHFPKKRDITYADAAKRLEKEIKERPNDPISKAAFQMQMDKLREHQERQKAEMEAERAQEAFNVLSPEEQVAVMQQAAAQQQAQDEAIEQQAAQEQMVAQQQPSPEEAAMMQQQMTVPQEQVTEQPVETSQPAVMAAEGGKLTNKYDLGGDIINALGMHTIPEFVKWAKDNKVNPEWDWDDIAEGDTPDWEALLKSDSFKAALAKQNPALAHALANSYDFGRHVPGNTEATIQSIAKGNWLATDGKGWRGSDDLAFRQAVEGLSDAEIDTLTTEQLAERMRKTSAYQNTNKWLQKSDNALLYLNTLLNNPDTPEVAREYARKFVKDGKWKDGFNYDYATVFGTNGKGVRETDPGTYWHSVAEADRQSNVLNFEVTPDGKVVPVVGSVPSDWQLSDNYTWADPDTDYRYNYYRRPVPTVPADASNGTPAPVEEPVAAVNPQRGVEPILRNGSLRYIGLLGPAAALGMMAAGIGRPNYRELDRAQTIADRGVRTATYQPIGDYIRYSPLDIWSAENRQNAQNRATQRSLINQSSPSRDAGLIALASQENLGAGQLFRQSQEYNDALKRQAAEFNRGTNQYNSTAFNNLSQFNTGQVNQGNQFRAQMAMRNALERMDADASWYNSLYGNVGNMFKSIADLGRENSDYNTMARLATSGAYAGITPEGAVRAGLARYIDAGGGELKKEGKRRKRGLTY